MIEAVIPSKASTIIVVRRDSGSAFEVLMTRRPQEMQFLAGYVVFPGGGVETEDWSDKMLSRCRGLSPSEAQQKLGGGLSPEISLGHWVAAARELFEETGVHFFVHQGGEPVDPRGKDSIERMEQGRKALMERRMDLPQFLESERLFCDLTRMTYLFHRTTPESYKLRFETRFYLATLPENQVPLTSSEEVAESLWIAPEAALERSQSGQFPLLPPTMIALRTLAEHKSWPVLRAAFNLA